MINCTLIEIKTSCNPHPFRRKPPWFGAVPVRQGGFSAISCERRTELEFPAQTVSLLAIIQKHKMKASICSLVSLLCCFNVNSPPLSPSLPSLSLCTSLIIIIFSHSKLSMWFYEIQTANLLADHKYKHWLLNCSAPSPSLVYNLSGFRRADSGGRAIGASRISHLADLAFTAGAAIIAWWRREINA